MRCNVRGLALALGVSLALAACGGGDEPEETSQPEQTTAPTDISAELTWWDTSDPTNEGPAFEALIEQFNEQYPDVTINYQSVPFGEAQNNFRTAAAAGSGAPDILRAEVAWVAEFASLGYLFQLDGTPLVEDQDDFLPAPVGSTQFDGGTYGVPQVTDSLALLYNKALFEQAGLDPEAPPTTWEEVETAAAALQESGVEGIFINNGGYFVLPFIYGEGGDLLDTEAQEITVNDEAAVAGMSIAQGLVESGAAVRPPATDAYGNMMTLFNEQRVGMILNGPWEVNNVRNAETFGGIDNLGIAPVPAGSQQAGAPVGGHNYVVWSGMDESKADAAIAFVDFMSSAESQAFLAEELGLLPTRASAYDMVDSEIIAAFQPVMEVAVERAWIPEAGNLFGPLDEATTQVLVQGTEPQAALDGVASTYASEVVPDYAD